MMFVVADLTRFILAGGIAEMVRANPLDLCPG
jgi:hypothetical protein